ncbi:MFS transporter, CP family, cyanate transporter [Modestobacter sp. DSM 44400]|uniref:MFS transporter n=1 Tax=Modestobacter sp. DSM 44400 TaxID=1550230 RepID=UPI000894422E|nr:MFS transporter [Modestobacter sp. DSM 44400]SDY54223.1 MFS transporter, CP family, cyanate transporter [Modestobacter sp. DSM 44400]
MQQGALPRVDDEGPGTGRTRGATLLLGTAVVVVALNQRPAVVGIAPVLRDLRADTGLTSALAGLLTALPVLCFGAFAPFAPRLARRIGLETAVAGSLVLLAAGIALRLLSPVAFLYAGSLVAGAAIAVANVLMPAYVKREFRRPGTVMGLYSAALNVGAAAAAGLTVPIGVALGLDWRLALGSWLLLAVAGLALWLPVAGVRHDRTPADPAGPGAWSLLRTPLARQVTVFLGLQSVQFYSIGTWLPTLLADAGVPVGKGGLLLAVSNVVGAAGALLAPTQAGRMRSQRPLVVVLLLAYVVGLTGLLVTPSTGTFLWVAVFGLAQGGGFALALTLIVLRSATPLVAAGLGGVAQCLGYLLAAAGPVVFGALHDVTGGWSWPLALLLVLLLPMAWAGWGAARHAVLGT